LSSDGSGVITYNNNDITYQGYLTTSELKDIHKNSVTNSGSSKGFILYIPLSVNGNTNYGYTLTLPLVNTSTASNLAIKAWDGANYTIDLIQATYSLTTGYKKITLTFTQKSGSTTQVIFNKIDIGGTTYNLASANTSTLNSGNLEIYFNINKANSDLKTSYYVLSVSKFINNNH